MPTVSTRDAANGPDVAEKLTDGYHLVVESLKLNDVDTIYGVVGIPITDACATRAMPATLRRPRAS